MSKLTTECGRVRHGLFISTMCGGKLTEDRTRATGARRYFDCEHGHTLVAVKHCGVWTMIEEDRQACERCGDVEFNTSGQELCDPREWDGPEDDY